MENLTVGEIYQIIGWLVGFGGATAVIVQAVKKAIASAFKPINDKIDTVDLNATKNFLVRTLADIEKEGIDDVTKVRFYEQLEHYQKLGGNSYIMSEVERMKKQGKL